MKIRRKSWKRIHEDMDIPTRSLIQAAEEIISESFDVSPPTD